MSNEEQKIAELENDPVSKLLGGLKRVDAPGDFDFRVKARIASGRPAERNRSWLPASVRLAVPLGLLLLIGGYFGLNAIYSPDNLAVAPVVTQDVTPVADTITTEPPAEPAKEVIAKSVESNPPMADSNINTKPAEKRIVLSGPTRRHVGVRPIDTARGISKTLNMSAKDVLSYIGIEADALWKVGSVRQNSMADRSGLKAGDVIEAINDQNLADRSTFGNKFRSKSLRVNRDGKSIQIDLKP